MKKSGFTLIELLVVVGIIMVLAGAMTSSVASARKRAKISAATVTVREVTNAILMYENYKDLSSHVIQAKTEATKSNLGFILGEAGERSTGGEAIPVLYQGSLIGNKLVDPWGNAYKVMIRKAQVNVRTSGRAEQSIKQTAVRFPNFYRRTPWEED